MKNKFNLIFIIGNEGTGHHLFEKCISATPVPYSTLHKLIHKYFNVKTTPDEQSKIKIQINELTKNNIGTYCKESASFPFGRPADPLKSIDIFGFYELFSSMPHVNLFFVVLTRNIIYSTLSTKNRFDKNNSIFWAARLQENCLSYINNQIQLIPEENYIIVELSNIANNIKKFKIILEEKSKMNFKFNFNAVKISDNSKYFSNLYYDYLSKYFNETRLKQFDFLKNNTYLL